MQRAILLFAAFAAGFTITGVEIALGRLLAPFFGSGLAVWAAIIASVIAALSVGYPVGGVLADRRPGLTLPVTTLAVGGVVAAVAGVAAPWVLRGWMEGVGMSGPAFWTRLAATLLAFGLPCVCLATVSPAVIRATLKGKESAGRDAGLVYALGSVGSVLGILLPALWWIPELGLRTTFAVLGAIAVIPALLALFTGVRGPAVAALGLLVLPALPTAKPPAERGVVIFEAESPIQHVRVVAQDTPQYKRRWLHLEEGWATHSSYVEPHLVTGDVWDWMALSALRPEPEDGQLDVLIIGLAAGTVAQLILGPLGEYVDDPHVVGVEIDPLVAELARTHFMLPEDVEVHVGDGRTFLRGDPRRWDLVILDAYAQPTIPAHLATEEFFGEVRRSLAPGGLAVLNVFSPADRSPLLDGLVATWTAVFADSETVEGPPQSGFRSRLLLGGPALERSWPAVEVPGTFRRSYALVRSSTETTVYARLPPWTDDRAPVERLTDAAFRSLRQ